MTHPPLAVVVKGWPRLSETFIAQELVALEAAGLSFDLWSLRFPDDEKTHPLHAQLKASVRYLPEYLHREPVRVLRAWRGARKMQGYARAKAIWFRDLKRDRSRNRVRRFGQACVMAFEMATGTRGIYSHFLHTPSSVARYVSALQDIPWSFSAHARDIWTTPEWELAEKLSGTDIPARFGVTCTSAGAEALRVYSDTPDNVVLVYHGLDLNRFPPPPDNRPKDKPFRMLSVGRLVEKKGFDRLLDALALLPKGFAWQWTHIGGGGLADTLADQAERLGLSGRIHWAGEARQPEVIKAMRSAHLFVLPSRIARDGDRDGLPNVLMEAASQKLPILATPVSAIPEFIKNGIHGTLVECSPQPLACAIIRLAMSPCKREQMASAAFDRLVSEFGMDSGIATLRDRLLALTGDR